MPILILSKRRERGELSTAAGEAFQGVAMHESLQEFAVSGVRFQTAGPVSQWFHPLFRCQIVLANRCAHPYQCKLHHSRASEGARSLLNGVGEESHAWNYCGKHHDPSKSFGCL